MNEYLAKYIETKANHLPYYGSISINILPLANVPYKIYLLVVLVSSDKNKITIILLAYILINSNSQSQVDEPNLSVLLCQY